jgi:hypothetical protein
MRADIKSINSKIEEAGQDDEEFNENTDILSDECRDHDGDIN